VLRSSQERSATILGRIVSKGNESQEDSHLTVPVIALSCDEDSNVRDWATFGLGSIIDIDSTAIREALLARLKDDDDETRIEAIEGLALRGDARVVPVILREFDDDIAPEQSFLPSERLIEALQKMANDENYEGDKSELRQAIEQCEAYIASWELEA
jgi:HEAT repeat protein